MDQKPASFLVIFALLTALFFTAPAWGQFGENDAFTPTKSNNLIVGKLVTPAGGEFSFAVREGEWLRITDDETGRTHAYQARLTEEKEIYFDEYAIKKHRGGESVAFTGRDFRANVGESFLAPDTGYEIQIQGFELRPPQDNSDPSLDPFEKAHGTKSVCCVSCLGSTVCGCSVSSRCGSCCSGSCCGGGPGPGYENQ